MTLTSPTEISVKSLARLIGLPDAPVLLDVRLEEDRAADPTRLPAAILCDPFNPEAALELVLGRACVVYCQKGGKVSQVVAARLRAAGQRAETLQGGHLGWVAAGETTVPLETPTSYVTRQRPKIDRIATPWLIRRFVNPKAEFLFVARDQVLDAAAKFGATPFDVQGCELSHVGDHCSFDAAMKAYDLDSPALRAVARIVRAADTDHVQDAPQAAGLLAVSVGLSRQYRDDYAQLEAGMAIYDALYRWARDGQDEVHDWPSHTGGSL